MIKINKGNEPATWTQKKETPGFTQYEPTDDLRMALLKEQGFICAFCMREIPVKDKGVKETSKIEHLKSRKDRHDLQLDYNNMVICCPGYLKAEAHCDKSKGSTSVTFTLFTNLLPDTLTYSIKNGTISSRNTIWNKEVNDILNLNNKLLAYNRLYVLTGIKEVLENKKWKKAKIEEKLEEWVNPDTNGKLKPYCGIVIWYLQKKLRKQP
jgi:uncharacterized protein (TIGR02646 family)